MASWRLPAVLVCSYGFFKALRPSEAFLTPYLTGPDKNISADAVYSQVYPIWTYSYLVSLALVFLLTDLLRYKSVIVFEAITYIITWVIILWANGILAMQFMQFVYGLATATEIAYYSYIYAIVSPEKYRLMSGCTRSAILIAKCFAYTVGQILVSTDTASYFTLNCISLGSVCVSFVIAILLPSVQTSVYFHRHNSAQELQSRRNSIRSKNGSRSHQSTSSESNQHHVNEAASSKVTGNQSSNPDPAHNRDIEDDEFFLARHTHSFSSSKSGFESSNQTLSATRSPYSSTDIDTSSLGFTCYDTGPCEYSDGSICASSEQQQQSSTIPTTQDTENTSDIYNKVFVISCCDRQTCMLYLQDAFKNLWKDFITSYSNKLLLIWSIWWAISSCGNFQVGNYIQNLWLVVAPNQTHARTYNGGVEAVSTFLGASSSLGISFIPANWNAYGELLLGVVSLANCALLVIIALSTNIWVTYSLYVLFRAAYQMVITVATYQIAKHLKIQSYSLVFGFNTFIALCLETILTAVIVDKRGLNVGVRTQFLVNGGYFGLMGLILIGAFLYNLQRTGCVSCRVPEDVIHERLEEEE